MTSDSKSFYDGEGVYATPYTGTATATPTYPADFNGGVTTTAALSVLNGAKAVQLLGIRVTSATGLSTMSFVNHAGTAINITGNALIPTTAAGLFIFGQRNDGVRYVNLTNANVGFTCTNAAVRFLLFWRKLY